MFYNVNVADVRGLDLPGRNWKILIGPDKGGAKNLIFGVVTFPPDSTPKGHSHETEEEVIYVLSGAGEMVFTEKERVELCEGEAVFIPPNVDHRVVVTGEDPLVMVSLFSPPLIPGIYDRK